jgi:hypothetical protein
MEPTALSDPKVRWDRPVQLAPREQMGLMARLDRKGQLDLQVQPARQERTERTARPAFKVQWDL